jgi:hypothetical protein
MRLAKRLRQQQAALSAAARCQDGVDSARIRAEELSTQGASLIAAAEKALAAAMRQLVEVMGSTGLAAAVLDLDETAVRKAMAAQRPRATTPPMGDQRWVVEVDDFGARQFTHARDPTIRTRISVSRHPGTGALQPVINLG